MRIGNFTPDNNIFLAPMAGITDMSFRILCKEQGCGLVYSEMISAKGIYYNDKKTLNMLKISKEEKPVAVQIFGSDPYIMGQAASIVNETGASILDLNFGCPAPKITKNGEGSILLKNPKKIGEIVKSVVGKSKLPVTVKIRKGWDDSSINALEVAQVAQENGAKAVTIHGRTAMQFYKGKADWEIIRKVKKGLDIPVIGNGDIISKNDVFLMFEQTGVDAIMIGRGARGNPWIFNKDREEANDKKQKEVRKEEIIRMIIRHLDMLILNKGEFRAVREIRSHIIWYLKGLKNTSRLKAKIFTLIDRNTIVEALEEYLKGRIINT